MPMFIGASKPSLNLMRVDLNTGLARTAGRGVSSTIDWFADGSGKKLAREDYTARSRKHRIYSYLSGRAELVFEEVTRWPRISVGAVSEDGQALLFTSLHDGGEALQRLSLRDGAISEPVFEVQDRDIDSVLALDADRSYVGVRLSGLVPETVFSAPAIQAAYEVVAASFPAADVRFVSSTADRSVAIFNVSGNAAADDIVEYRRDGQRLAIVGQGYRTVSITGPTPEASQWKLHVQKPSSVR